MQWFKHDCDAINSQTAQYLISKCGMAGYGMFVGVMEKIGASMDGADCSTSVTYTLKVWSNFFQISPKKFRDFAEILQNLPKKLKKDAKIFVEVYEDEGDVLLRFDYPAMLKKRDEYSKKKERKVSKNPDNVQTNSGQCPDTIRTSSGQCPEREDKEEDKEKIREDKNKRDMCDCQSHDSQEVELELHEYGKSFLFKVNPENFSWQNLFEEFKRCYPRRKKSMQWAPVKTKFQEKTYFATSEPLKKKVQRWYRITERLTQYEREIEAEMAEKESQGKEYNRDYIKTPAAWLNLYDWDEELEEGS